MTWKITEDQRGGVGFILRLINDYESLIFSHKYLCALGQQRDKFGILSISKQTQARSK